MSLISCCVACCPSMFITGSPGARWISINAMRVTPRITGIICKSLLMIYHFIFNQQNTLTLSFSFMHQKIREYPVWFYVRSTGQKIYRPVGYKTNPCTFLVNTIFWFACAKYTNGASSCIVTCASL